MITEEQINKHAEQEYKGSSKGTMIDLYPMARQGSIAGMKKAIELMTPGWVSVKDRLPENTTMKNYLVTIRDASYRKVWVSSLMFYEGQFKSVFLDDITYVTHWSPLPEPPKTD